MATPKEVINQLNQDDKNLSDKKINKDNTTLQSKTVAAPDKEVVKRLEQDEKSLSDKTVNNDNSKSKLAENAQNKPVEDKKKPEDEKATEKIRIAKLYEALLLPDTYKYPESEHEKQQVALRIKEIIDADIKPNNIDIEKPIKPSAKTVLECAKISQNSYALLVLEQYLRDDKIIEVLNRGHATHQEALNEEEKNKKEMHTQFLKIAEKLKENCSFLIDKRGEILEIMREHQEQALDKSPKAKQTIREIFNSTVLPKIQSDHNSLSFFKEIIEKLIEKDTYRLMGLYPMVVHYIKAFKFQAEELQEQLKRKKIPEPVRKKIKKALQSRKILETIFELKEKLEKYDPGYTKRCREILKYDTNLNIFSAMIMVENHDFIANLNEKYHKSIYEYIEKECRARKAEDSKLFGDKLNLSYVNEVGELLAKTIKNFLKDQELSKHIGTTQAFAILYDTEMYAIRVSKIIFNSLEVVRDQWLKSSKQEPLDVVLKKAAQKIVEHITHEEVRAHEIKVQKELQKELEQKKREENANMLNEQKKQEEIKKEILLSQKAVEAALKVQKDKIFSSLIGLSNNERADLLSLLEAGRSFHDKFDTERFCKLVDKIKPFNLKTSKKGYILFFGNEVVTSFHRQHEDKKLDGNVINLFLEKLKDLQILSKLIQELRGMTAHHAKKIVPG